jgi:hypothetical protein
MEMVEVKEKEKKASSLPSRIRRGKGSRSKLHPREVMLVRRLWFEGWNDYQIWKEYRIPFPDIQMAKNEIERQATEEFENKEMLASELAKLKHLLKLIKDYMDSIAKDPKVPYAGRLNSERIKVEALASLQDVLQASLSSSEPYSALDKNC